MHECEVAPHHNYTIWYLPSHWLDQCNLKKTSRVKWTSVNLNQSSQQSNAVDCGVHATVNGLACTTGSQTPVLTDVGYQRAQTAMQLNETASTDCLEAQPTTTPPPDLACTTGPPSTECDLNFDKLPTMVSYCTGEPQPQKTGPRNDDELTDQLQPDQPYSGETQSGGDDEDDDEYTV